MHNEQVAQLRAQMQSERTSAAQACERVCRACPEILGVDGAGIILFDDDGHVSTMSVSDGAVGRLEELQFLLGEGPGVEAHTTGRMVWEPDLTLTASSRWTAYAPAAAEQGVGAVFAFPLRTGGVRLGALDVYRHLSGPLDRAQTTDAVELADLATMAMLFLQPGAASHEVQSGREIAGGIHARVHQAAGMISEQLDVTVGEALARLRAYAYAAHEPVDGIAREVIARRLRVDEPPE
ncbi:MAG: GAF domain-containing protein [Acidimicrobiia bacterium]